MSDINQNVNINVNANTQDASRDVERLENNIKTLDGAINLVGGSIEVLAGGLALTGAVTEEQAEKFQTAAVGAIALADGSKRILEGYKTLATETKVLTVIQRIYNTVMKANPLFLIVGVIAAVTLGVIALTKALKNQADEQERLNKLQSSERLLGFLERQLKLSKARGESAVEIARQEVRIAEEREKQAKAAIATAEDQEEARQKYFNAITDREVAEINLINAKNKAQQDAADAEKKRLEEIETERQKQLALRKTAVEEEIKLEQAAFDEFEKQYNKRKKLEDDEIKRRIAYDVARAKSAISTANDINQTEQKILDARIEIGQIGVDAFQEGLNAIFGESKGLAKAQVIIDAAQAAVGIIRKGTDPRNAEALVFPNAWIAANLGFLAATTATSLQAINSASAEGGGTTGTNYGGGAPSAGGGLSGPGFNLGAPTLGGTSGVSALQAIVLAGDVTSAQAQEAAIRNRRRFG